MSHDYHIVPIVVNIPLLQNDLNVQHEIAEGAGLNSEVLLVPGSTVMHTFFFLFNEHCMKKTVFLDHIKEFLAA